MIAIENPDGLSISIIAEGCDPDFLEMLPAHLAFSKEVFFSHGLELNGNLKQLVEIEKLIAVYREGTDWHTRGFFQGLVAYCGELLRSSIPGEWEMVKCNPCSIYLKTRYFPVIVDAKGRIYSFSGGVELELAYLLDPSLNWDKMNGLYYSINGSSRPDRPPRKSGILGIPCK